MDEWQPIETAPKDGTPILLGGGCDDSAIHTNGHEEFTSAPCRAMWLGGDWVNAFADAGMIAACYENPTHWMPLPPPPDTDSAIAKLRRD